MGRPIKKGLDYFPVDTDIFENIQVRKLKRAHGAVGFLVFMTLLCDIYRKEGYYLPLSDDYYFDLAERIGEDEESVRKIIFYCTETGLFNASLFNRYSILTSENIQSRYLAALKRSQSTIHPDYNCISVAETPVIEAETTPNAAESAQIKLKEKEENISITTTSSTACGKNEKPDYSFSGSCKRYREELIANEDWSASIVRMSGKGFAILKLLPEVTELFESHIISIGETGTLRCRNDYARRFTGWWRSLGYQSATEIIQRTQLHATPKAYPSRNAPDKPAPSIVARAMEASEKAAEIAIQLMKKGA